MERPTAWISGSPGPPPTAADQQAPHTVLVHTTCGAFDGAGPICQPINPRRRHFRRAAKPILVTFDPRTILADTKMTIAHCRPPLLCQRCSQVCQRCSQVLSDRIAKLVLAKNNSELQSEI